MCQVTYSADTSQKPLCVNNTHRSHEVIAAGRELEFEFVQKDQDSSKLSNSLYAHFCWIIIFIILLATSITGCKSACKLYTCNPKSQLVPTFHAFDLCKLIHWNC